MNELLFVKNVKTRSKDEDNTHDVFKTFTKYKRHHIDIQNVQKTSERHVFTTGRNTRSLKHTLRHS